jgi:glucokinase
MAAPVAVGVDVGGTNVRVATVAADGTVHETNRSGTPFGDPEALVDRIVGLLRGLGAGQLPVGVGIAGTVDRDGRVRYAANVGLQDAPVQQLLEDALGHEVVVRNDATVALWGERCAGAARGADDAVLLTLGTGVGGGLVVGGQLVGGTSGLATELGHVTVLSGGRECPCGNLGCLEAYTSGTAIGRRGAARLPTWDRETLLAGAERVTGAAVVDAAGRGDELAIEVVEEAGTWLGVGIATLVNALDPEVVVIGGGAGEAAFDLLLPAARTALRAHVFGLSRRTLPRVQVAELGDSAGVVGAALLATERRDA